MKVTAIYLVLKARPIDPPKSPLKRGTLNETDEAAATAWMNQQLEALGVEIPNLTESIRRHNV